MNRLQLIQSLWISFSKRQPPNDKTLIRVWEADLKESFTLPAGTVLDRLRLREVMKIEHNNFTHWCPIIGPKEDD